MWQKLMGMVPVGSTPWLLAHELRVSTRRATLNNKFMPLILIGLLVVVCLGAGMPLARQFPGPVMLTPHIAASILIGCLFLLAISISQSLTVTIQMFFERGDFDLLFSSPIPPSRVLYVRLIAIAFSPFLYFSAFLTCILLPLMVLDDPRLFGAYGVLAVISILSALIAVALGMALYRWFGPRRTRMVGHFLAVTFAAIFIVCAQAPQYFEYHPLSPEAQHIVHHTLDAWFGPHSPLLWPGEAVFGAPGPLIGLILFAVLAFWLLASRLGHSFAAMTAAAQGKDAPVRVKNDVRPLSGFSGAPLWVLVRKEWRQLLRDPMLLSQVLLQGLFVVPMIAGLFIGSSAANAQSFPPDKLHMISMVGLASALMFVVSVISGALVEIIVMGEDAPELVASAPISRDKVRFAKLFAALFPVGVLAVVLTAGLAVQDLWAGCIALVMCFLAAYSVCYITFWYEKPQPQKNFRRKQVEGTLITRLSKFLLTLTFIPVTALAVMKSWLALPFALLPVIVLGILYVCRRYDI